MVGLSAKIAVGTNGSFPHHGCNSREILASSFYPTALLAALLLFVPFWLRLSIENVDCIVSLLGWETFVPNLSNLGTWWPGRLDKRGWRISWELLGTCFVNTLLLDNHLHCWSLKLGRVAADPRSFNYPVDRVDIVFVM